MIILKFWCHVKCESLPSETLYTQYKEYTFSCRISNIKDLAFFESFPKLNTDWYNNVDARSYNNVKFSTGEPAPYLATIINMLRNSEILLKEMKLG